MRIQCKTLVDCAPTGVVGHYRLHLIPFQDRLGNWISDQQTWNHRRNQQRNWETLLQIVGLRCQPVDINGPQHSGNCWSFEFSVEQPGIFTVPDLTELYQDADTVPMLQNLSDGTVAVTPLVVAGPSQNIWFQEINMS